MGRQREAFIRTEQLPANPGAQVPDANRPVGQGHGEKMTVGTDVHAVDPWMSRHGSPAPAEIHGGQFYAAAGIPDANCLRKILLDIGDCQPTAAQLEAFDVQGRQLPLTHHLEGWQFEHADRMATRAIRPGDGSQEIRTIAKGNDEGNDRRSCCIFEDPEELLGLQIPYLTTLSRGNKFRKQAPVRTDYKRIGCLKGIARFLDLYVCQVAHALAARGIELVGHTTGRPDEDAILQRSKSDAIGWRRKADLGNGAQIRQVKSA